MRPSLKTPPYSVLAAGYDAIMAHVDYRRWSRFLEALIDRHHPRARSVHELACGTGCLALELQPASGFEYTASDVSREMLALAKAKADEAAIPVSFRRLDYMDFSDDARYDVVLLLYDAINYLTDPADVPRLLENVGRALRPEGIFIFDQSTPANSARHESHFDGAGSGGPLRYVRTNSYDPESRRHTTVFRLETGGRIYTETHVQRAYSLEEMNDLITRTDLAPEAAYDGFTRWPADERSERIHHVLRRTRLG